ncbi:hypothetical protein EOPP23_20380 [Endozoicomonas sp. OPT23]|uniref:protein kinase domain-containing protein n=1 Tax=Endozoicomonas sp. OPT23 TaxID=2072845 RepID=UPI00129BF178|nr:protein kinase [Endozoicomonas sp. OPT23]MRI35319.1 hypothetical protein [Endozoicomonas sp. OPT23]
MTMERVFSGPDMPVTLPPSNGPVNTSLRSRIKQRVQRSALYRYFIVKPLAFFRTHLIGRFTRNSDGAIRVEKNIFFRRPEKVSVKPPGTAPHTDQPDSTLEATPEDMEVYQGRSPRLISLKKLLGKGGSGEVREVDTSEGTKARKTLKEGKKSKELDDEYRILKELNHPNILKVDEIDPSEPTVAISEDEETEPGFVMVDEVDMNAVAGLQMDKADSSLRDAVGKLNRAEALKYARQLTDALNYLNGQGVAWLDIKPDNILVKNRKLLLADFGGAVKFEPGTAINLKKPGTGFSTTSVYSSPELWGNYLAKQKTSDLDASKCMSWSLGITLAELLTGERVFRKQHVMKAVSDKPALDDKDQKGSKKNYKPVGDIQYQQVIESYLAKHGGVLGEQVVQLLSSLLQPEPSKRMSLSDAMNVLERLPDR